MQSEAGSPRNSCTNISAKRPNVTSIARDHLGQMGCIRAIGWGQPIYTLPINHFPTTRMSHHDIAKESKRYIRHNQFLALRETPSKMKTGVNSPIVFLL